MSLKKVVIPTYTFEAPGNGEPVKVSVRGITLNELTVIARDYAPDAAMAFGKIMQRAKLRKAGSPQVTTEEVKDVLKSLLPSAPKMAGAIIALAADEYEPATVEIASKLPIATQIVALEQIFNMTFQGDAELKKLLESITRMLGGLTSAVQQMRLPLSELGIGASDAA